MSGRFALLAYHLRRLGWPGQAGLLLLGAAAVLAGPLAEDLATREAALRGEARTLAGRLADRAGTVAAGRPAAPLAAESFPPASAAPAFLLDSHEAARRHRLRLARGDLRSLPEAAGKLTRHRLELPAEGRYPDVRAWLAELMNRHPGLVLEALDLRRRDIGEDRIEATVRLALLTRAS